MIDIDYVQLIEKRNFIKINSKYNRHQIIPKDYSRGLITDSNSQLIYNVIW